MGYYRTKDESKLKNYGKYRELNVIQPEEWLSEGTINRIYLDSWKSRYKYESKIISSVIQRNGYTKILELGSGPGVLGQHIISTNKNINYTFIDNTNAKNIHKKNNFVGEFIVKDLLNEFDIFDLDTDYDMVIANDFLEHICNPSDILYKLTLLTKQKSSLFVSVPNWRMGHTFIYRGLFDYDNFVYFGKVHGWDAEQVSMSPLKCNHSPKLDSESMMPDSLITSWNWYFNFNKIVEDDE